jgi:hypothetical protein
MTEPNDQMRQISRIVTSLDLLWFIVAALVLYLFLFR